MQQNEGHQYTLFAQDRGRVFTICGQGNGLGIAGVDRRAKVWDCRSMTRTPQRDRMEVAFTRDIAKMLAVVDWDSFVMCKYKVA